LIRYGADLNSLERRTTMKATKITKKDKDGFLACARIASDDWNGNRSGRYVLPSGKVGEERSTLARFERAGFIRTYREYGGVWLVVFTVEGVEYAKKNGVKLDRYHVLPKGAL
jgi:hypothetical protein